MSRPIPQPPSTFDTTARWPDRRAAMLWTGVAVALFADLGLTALGHAMGYAELNPVAAAVLATGGIAGLTLLKLPALVLAGIAWWLLPRPYALVAPASVLVPWAAAACWNLVVLLA